MRNSKDKNISKDISKYLKTLATDVIKLGFSEDKLYKLVTSEYVSLLIQGSLSDRADKHLYRIVKGSICRYRGHKNQSAEINNGNATLIGDRLFFIKTTDEYSYFKIMTIMRNDHPSSPKGVEFSKYNIGDTITCEDDHTEKQSTSDIITSDSNRGESDLPWSQTKMILNDIKYYCRKDIENKFMDIVLHGKNKSILFRGVPGTGKTTLAKGLIKKFLGEDIDSRYSYTSLSETTSYTDIIGGTVMGRNGWEFKNGSLTNACIDAYNNHGKPVFYLLDEATRANMASALGEAFSLITFRDEPITTKYGRTLYIPSNLVIVGTMNSSDKGVQRLSTALQERFYIIDVEPEWTQDYLQTFSNSENELLLKLIAVVNKFNTDMRTLGLEDCQMGTRFLNDMIDMTNDNITDGDVRQLAMRLYDSGKYRLSTGVKVKYISYLDLIKEIAYEKL